MFFWNSLPFSLKSSSIYKQERRKILTVNANTIAINVERIIKLKKLPGCSHHSYNLFMQWWSIEAKAGWEKRYLCGFIISPQNAPLTTKRKNASFTPGEKSGRCHSNLVVKVTIISVEKNQHDVIHNMLDLVGQHPFCDTPATYA